MEEAVAVQAELEAADMAPAVMAEMQEVFHAPAVVVAAAAQALY